MLLRPGTWQVQAAILRTRHYESQKSYFVAALLCLVKPTTAAVARERRVAQDPLRGIRSMTDEEAEDICAKFSGRLRALMRVCPVRRRRRVSRRYDGAGTHPRVEKPETRKGGGAVRKQKMRAPREKSAPARLRLTERLRRGRGRTGWPGWTRPRPACRPRPPW